ncbi:MAG: dihydroneopterin aldolase [Gammaproteobacteria bacterium]|nr:dihydroneopterin aldolase [Gammaproteobacteria bacterium]
MDTLRITGLKVPTRIGIYPWEQQIDQTLSFDLSIPIDTKRCHDNLANTLDYAAVCQCITEFVRQQSFYLVENAAEQVLKLLQTTFAITHLSLTVTKLYAVKNAGAIQITVNR